MQKNPKKLYICDVVETCWFFYLAPEVLKKIE
jgi:hypothetical protein